MKTLTVEIPDKVYERAERRAAELGVSLREEIAELIERFGGEEDEAVLADARSRMQEAFRTIKGFRGTPKIPREELYDRGSLR